MKVGLILLGDIKHCPFVNKYLNSLEELKIEYEIILWNRDKKIKNYSTSKFCKKIHEFTFTIDRNSKTKKIFAYFLYKIFVKKAIKKNKYNKLIIFETMTGVINLNFYTKKYKNKYFFDYRDVSYENYSFYKNKVSKLIENSYETSISSLGFKNVLPTTKNYLVAHNFNNCELNNMIGNVIFEKKQIINVAFVGMIREWEMCKKMLSLFGNDYRFNLNIYGDGIYFDDLSKIASCYKNIKLYGAFDLINKKDIYSNVDMIIYFYPTNFVNMNALANKFYDGLIYKKLLIGNLETFSGQLINDKYLGCCFNWNESEELVRNRIFKFYNNVNSEKFNNAATTLLNDIVIDDKHYLEKIKEFLLQ